MKITITQEFETIEDAAAFLAQLAPQPTFNINFQTSDAAPGVPAATLTQPTPQPAKKPRKPRSDAGQPRGEYRHRTTGGTDLSPASPTTSAEPVKSAATGLPQAAQAPASAEPAAKTDLLTLPDLRKALKELHDIKGQGMEATIAAIQHFGVNRISDLPITRYDEFGAYVREQIAAAVK